MQLKLGQVDTVMIPCVTNTMRLLECYKPFLYSMKLTCFVSFRVKTSVAMLFVFFSEIRKKFPKLVKLVSE